MNKLCISVHKTLSAGLLKVTIISGYILSKFVDHFVLSSYYNKCTYDIHTPQCGAATCTSAFSYQPTSCRRNYASHPCCMRVHTIEGRVFRRVVSRVGRKVLMYLPSFSTSHLVLLAHPSRPPILLLLGRLSSFIPPSSLTPSLSKVYPHSYYRLCTTLSKDLIHPSM